MYHVLIIIILVFVLHCIFYECAEREKKQRQNSLNDIINFEVRENEQHQTILNLCVTRELHLS